MARKAAPATALRVAIPVTVRRAALKAPRLRTSSKLFLAPKRAGSGFQEAKAFTLRGMLPGIHCLPVYARARYVQK